MFGTKQDIKIHVFFSPLLIACLLHWELNLGRKVWPWPQWPVPLKLICWTIIYKQTMIFFWFLYFMCSSLYFEKWDPDLTWHDMTLTSPKFWHQLTLKVTPFISCYRLSNPLKSTFLYSNEICHFIKPFNQIKKFSALDLIK